MPLFLLPVLHQYAKNAPKASAKQPTTRKKSYLCTPFGAHKPVTNKIVSQKDKPAPAKFRLPQLIQT
ncbi:hypothetical protein C7N43_12240 [Sphingobacteriales bacterium UPWRP_1]|nr:hypothetical protein B6N25_13925 [Sphingobacteriales bacterium TSM_CSS]PSJ76712.1 hypothetical protein C7N43_12240 [Sphingobacteriales bacterium UPWRP_1]